MQWIKSVRKKLFKKTRKKLVNKIIVSRFFKGKMNILLINIVSFVLRLHINSLLCFLFCPGTSMLDFSLQILVSILTTVSDDVCFNLLNKCNSDFYKVTRYFLNNYTQENMDRWKKYLVLGINVYLMLILYFVSITSYLLILYSIQYLICFFIIDYFKKKKWMFFKKLYDDYMDRPVVIKEDDAMKIIDEHFNNEMKNKKLDILRTEEVNKDYTNVTTKDSEDEDTDSESEDETKDVSDNPVPIDNIVNDDYVIIN